MYRRLLQKRLQGWDYTAVAVEDGAKAWEYLQRTDARPALIILDWLMPGIDGIELCRRLRAEHKNPYQYIVLVSGKDDKRDVVEGLDAGADDYLTKPFDMGELQARLRSGIRILSLQQQLIETQEELRFQATHDALTGLWSRGAILDLLGCELRRGIRSEASTGILMVDLDHFKKINDTYGHLTGDSVLREAAIRIGRAVRSYDFVGRYGGEEFVAILSNCSQEELSAIAERTRRMVAEFPLVAGSAVVPATVSIGGAVARNGTPELELIAAADSALYEAKRAGRNRFVIGSCFGTGGRQHVAGTPTEDQLIRQ
jgi:two-component system cell cycle response regulator